ncbi:MAG: hypothetical protein FJ398_12010 [Verrucomicrobia bacterium]|nr:hypothetical protein [Verrucomicrobiota bacterium]
MSAALSPQILRCGTEAVPAEPIALAAGPLTMIFEPGTAFLRYIRVGDHEIVRAIYAAVRDRNWATITPQIRNLNVDSAQDSFRVTFDVECQEREIDFVWKGTLTGDSAGKVTFGFEGEARATFLRNRIGICVLHPISECAGKPCMVEHPDGRAEPGVFPRHISPDQPFKNIRALAYEPAPGVRAEVRFEGDVFEMEDQRNWTDASFKTYCTPLELGFPKQIDKGTRVFQSATVSLLGSPRKIMPVVLGRGAQISIATTPVLAKPAIGLGAASHGHPLTAKEIERLKALRLSHLRVDLRLADPNWPAALRKSANEAGQIGATLHVALSLTDRAEEELTALMRELEAVKPRVSLWMIFHASQTVTSEKWVRLAKQRLAAYGANILLAAGTDAYFVELNRQRPAADSWALPCYSVQPQVHAFDNATMVENLAGQAGTVESLQQFCRQAAVISPITLCARFNPDAAKDTPAGSATDSSELPSAVDVRQMSLFGAGWTLGSLSRLAAAGNIHSLTYYETTGWRGVMETEAGSPLPEKFRSIPGGVFPVYHLLADAAGFDRVCPAHSTHPLQVEGIALLDAQNRRRIVVANFLAEAQEVRIKTGTCRALVRYLDETNAEEAMRNPETFRARPGVATESVSGKIELQLLPYALARVDLST